MLSQTIQAEEFHQEVRKLFWDKVAVWYSCVCVFGAWWHSCRQNLEYSIITLAHPGRSRKATKDVPAHKHTYIQVHTHSHTRASSHHPHISLELRAPAEKLKHTTRGWGLVVVVEEGRAAGLGRSIRLVSDIETKVKRKPPVLFGYRPCSAPRHRTQPLHLSLWGHCFRAAGVMLGSTFAALQRLPARDCVSQLKYKGVSIPCRVLRGVCLVAHFTV